MVILEAKDWIEVRPFLTGWRQAVVGDFTAAGHSASQLAAIIFWVRRRTDAKGKADTILVNLTGHHSRIEIIW